MTISLAFWIPGPVIPLARPRVVRTHGVVRTFTPTSSQQYKRLVAIYALNARNRCEGWRRDWADYAIAIEVYREKHAGDWDNLAKGIQDGIVGVLIQDDRYVTSATVKVLECLGAGTNCPDEGAAVTVTMVGDVDAETARKERLRAQAKARRARA